MAMATWGRAAGALVIGLLLAVGTAMPSMAANVATVDGTPVTDQQVAQRVRLFEMEGNKTGRRGATEQLIDEAVQMNEAKRLGITVSNAQVDEALTQISRNIKLSKDKLLQMLQQNGVGAETLKDRLRAAIAWNAITQQAVAPQVQISDLDLDQKAAGQVSAYQQYDYILKEVLFLGSSGRTAQANKYRSSFNGCDNAVQLSLAYSDAAVVDVGRRHATQLPEAIAKELAGLNVGGITKPRTVENGVSMLAVCQKAQAQDLTFIKNDLEAQAGNDAIKSQAGNYMADLRKRAKIIYN